ncbi:hypothetical protein QMO56_09140 [Roseomonas sp. E05]|uniref:hypothetical protein n=1 Tax=Roseomonas sp. E05 TaxID=3046310 RepID=UPI0024BAF97F|nr:hypothetical protein [Roseomonas sp. E05]MDJ0388277.1 hypothetical protein [Roseomonas sp. E05]
MSNRYLPRLGQIVRWDGHPWMVHRLDSRGLDLRNQMTGEVLTWSLATWILHWQNGSLRQPTVPEPLDRRRLVRGTYIHRQGCVWRVKLFKSGLIHLENVKTDETAVVNSIAWQEECWRGESWVVDSPDADLPERIREVLRVPLDGLPSSMKAKVQWSAVFVEAYRDPERFYRERMPDRPVAERIDLSGRVSKATLLAFLKQVAEATGKKAPGVSTFYGWLNTLKLAGGDIRALAPRFDRQGPRGRKMPAMVEQWLMETITTHWLTKEQRSKAEVWSALNDRVDKWNKEKPGNKLWCPTESQVARYIREEVDQHAALRRRKGKKAYDKVRTIGDGVVTTFPLERVEVDHVRLRRLRVLDDRSGLDLGGAWVSIAYDHFTCMPLALIVQFEGETLGVGFCVLRMTMTPKGFLRKIVPDLDYDFPTGVPMSFFFDQTSATNNDHIREAALVLDMIMDYAEGENPQLKASIERFIRNLRDQTQRSVVGPNPPSHREENDPEKPDVTIRLSDLVRRLWTWVAMIYAKSWHGGIDDVPLRRWQEHTDKRLLRALRSEHDLTVLLTHRHMCLPRRGTVTTQGLTWKGEAIRQIVAHPSYREGEKVQVLFDEYDVARAWVTNPFTGTVSKVEPASRFMVGLTLHQHDRTLKMNGRLKRAYDTDELRARKAAMVEDALRLLAESKSLTKRQRNDLVRFLATFRDEAFGAASGRDAGEPEVGGDGAATDVSENTSDEPRAARPRRQAKRMRGDEGQ